MRQIVVFFFILFSWPAFGVDSPTLFGQPQVLYGENGVDLSGEDNAGRHVVYGDSQLFVGVSPYARIDVFELNAGAWERVSIIQAPAGQESTNFGVEFDVRGDFLVVGMPNYSDLNSLQGRAAVYEKDGSEQWVFQYYLEVPVSQLAAQFGTHVKFIDDALFITAIGAQPSNNHFTGGVYEYELDGTNWVYKRSIFPDVLIDDESGVAFARSFGQSLAVAQNRLLVGAPDYSQSAVLDELGQVYVFELNAGNWEQYQVLTYDDQLVRLQRFGISITEDNGDIYIGAEAPELGVNDTAGAVYRYAMAMDGTWARTETYSELSEGQAVGHGYGADVAFSGGVMVVGATYELQDGCNTDCGDTVYFYEREDSGEWSRYDRVGDAQTTHTHFGEKNIFAGDYLVTSSYSSSPGGQVYVYQPVYAVDSEISSNAPAQGLIEGEQITFTLSVENVDPFSDSLSIGLSGSFPTDLSFSSSSGLTCSEPVSGTLQCDNDSFLKSSKKSISATFQVDSIPLSKRAEVHFELLADKPFQVLADQLLQGDVVLNSPPEFTGDDSRFVIRPGLSNGNRVGVVVASDPDNSDFITNYAIDIDNGNNLFDIDSSGVITIARAATIEAAGDKTYTGQIFATDGKSTSEPLDINIVYTTSSADGGGSGGKISNLFVFGLLALFGCMAIRRYQ